MTEHYQNQTNSFFDVFTEAEKNLFFAQAKVIKYNAGEVIFRRGDVGDYFICLESGIVKLQLHGANGKEIILKVIDAGNLFGEFAFLDGSERSTDAIAQTACVAHVFSQKDVLPLFEQQPLLSLKLARYLAKLLRQNTEKIEALLALPFATRLAQLLTSRAVYQQESFTQADYAHMVGVSRENVNKQFKLWSKQKIISYDKAGLVILDPQALQNIANNSY